MLYCSTRGAPAALGRAEHTSRNHQNAINQASVDTNLNSKRQTCIIGFSTDLPRRWIAQEEATVAQAQGWQIISLGPRILRRDSRATSIVLALEYLTQC